MNAGTFPVPSVDPGKTVLIIDDDPLAHALVGRRLSAAGYQVICESDGGAGIARARVEQPALVICDLHMPMAPGELVILALRLSPATAHLPILVVSADPSRLGPEHTVDGVLAKPVRPNVLLETVAKLMGGAARGARQLAIMPDRLAYASDGSQ